jgi:hypothetical protein
MPPLEQAIDGLQTPPLHRSGSQRKVGNSSWHVARLVDTGRNVGLYVKSETSNEIAAPCTYGADILASGHFARRLAR